MFAWMGSKSKLVNKRMSRWQFKDVTSTVGKSSNQVEDPGIVRSSRPAHPCTCWWFYKSQGGQLLACCLGFLPFWGLNRGAVLFLRSVVASKFSGLVFLIWFNKPLMSQFTMINLHAGTLSTPRNKSCISLSCVADFRQIVLFIWIPKCRNTSYPGTRTILLVKWNLAKLDLGKHSVLLSWGYILINILSWKYHDS